MINLDISILEHRALNIDGCYIAQMPIPKRVKSVLLNGVPQSSVFYCDTNIGFAVLHKAELNGKLITVDGQLVYDLFFGKVEVIFDDMEKPTD